ncbi:alanine racemase [Fructilactobacillus vespulae]|uniref:alanine racemase n=1 Tax=Fructilactobacillus vespulae TaxID=1249630 RepID=UPI0039B456DE
MVVSKNRNAQLIIDKTAIFNNISNKIKRLKSGTEMFMVVKADAYGHGAVQVAAIAKAAGATGFCVALLDEAIELREAGFVEEPILVLGITDVELLPVIEKYDVTVTVSSLKWILDSKRLMPELNLHKPIKIFLALDTGMGRIGLRNLAEVQEFVGNVENDELINLQGVYTHFSTADSADNSYFEGQVQQFKKLMQGFKTKPRYVSVANSATSLWHDYTGSNVIRYGISAYGLNPSGEALESPFKLEPALSFTSELVYVKKVTAESSIGYGATYQANEAEWIGTVPVGYADGVSRKMQGFEVLVNGIRCPIVGRVCMDQFMIRLPQEFAVGTQVTIVGKDHDQVITLQDLANQCGTIHYEIACGFSNRLPRVYR